MDATIHPLPVKTGPDTFDLDGWEILFARHLLDGAVLVTPSERITWAYEAGLTGVAQAMERLSGIRAEAGLDRAADESADLIRAAASRR